MMIESIQNLWIAGYPFFGSWITLVGTDSSRGDKQSARILVYDADGGECYREELALGFGEVRVIQGADLLMAVKLESGLKHARVVIANEGTSLEKVAGTKPLGMYGYTQFVTAEGARPYSPRVHRVRSHAGAYFPVLFGQRVSSLLTIMNSSLDAVIVSVWIDNREGPTGVRDDSHPVFSVPGRGTRVISLADEFLIEDNREVFMAPVRVKAKRTGAELEVAITEIITGQSGIRLAGVS